MPDTVHLDQFYIHLNGNYLRDIYMDNVVSIEVDDSLYLPDMFTITLRDPDLKMLHEDVFRPGAEVKISARKRAADANSPSPPPQVLVIGEITALEPDLNSSDRTMLVVRGYDRSHKLNRVRKTQTFTQVKDSDLATRLASGAGLSAEVDATSVVHKYIMQSNQTDLELLIERAKLIGYRVYVEDRKLYFKKPPSSPPETEMEWGISLEHFHARMSTLDQVAEVTVRGWDPGAKAAIVSTVSTASVTHSNGVSQTGSAMASSAHGVTGKGSVVNMPVRTESEARVIAQATLDRMAANFMQIEGSCSSQPSVLAGTRVKVKGVGARFNGKYLVTRVLHRYDSKGHQVRFWASGGNGTMTITDLLTNGGSQGSGQGGGKPTERGVMIGIVTNNKDDENQGRVKVKFPELGDNVESYWCRMASTMAGPDRGIAMLPEANDEVVVAFQHGDPNHGVVLGCLWNGSDKLPKPLSQLVTGGLTIRRVIKSRVGHQLIIDDTEDPGGWTIIDKTNDNKIVINTKENTILVEAKNDITIHSKTGKVTIDGQNGVDIKGNDGNVAITTTKDITGAATQNVKFDASQKLSLSGTTGIDISTPQNLTMSGTAGVDISSTATAKMSGTATAEVSSSGQTKVSGTQVQISGTAEVEVSGPMAQINGSGMLMLKGGMVMIN